MLESQLLRSTLRISGLSLYYNNRRDEGVPLVLLKNGKRGKEEFASSQSRQREKKADGSSGIDGCGFEGGPLSTGAGCQMQ